MKKMRLPAVVLALGLVVGACGGDSYDRGDAIDELVDGGLTREQAECVVDRAEDTFGIEKLSSDDEPTDEEQRQIGEIVTQCLGVESES